MKKNMLSLAAWGLLASAAAAQDSPREVDEKKDEVVNKLNSIKVSVDFKDHPLQDVVSYLRELSGLNIVVDSEVFSKHSEDQLKITLKVKDLPLKSVLKLMLSARDLTATYKEGVLFIVPKDKVDRAVLLQIYDVRDLLLKLQDFVGPRVELVAPGGQGGRGGGPLTGATFTLDEPRETLSPEFITEMIKSNTGSGTWESNPNASITLANGMLVVSQSKHVHEEVKRLLNLLRQFK